jgi:hypothetical protein
MFWAGKDRDHKTASVMDIWMFPLGMSAHQTGFSTYHTGCSLVLKIDLADPLRLRSFRRWNYAEKNIRGTAPV